MGERDRLESIYKDMEDVKILLKSVETSLIGNELNGNKGMVHLLDDIDKMVSIMEKKNILYDEAIFNYKWAIKGLVAGGFGFIWWFLKK
jgi:hypothetical protein